MWCIPTVDAQFVERMEGLLTLYAKPRNPREPVLCFDEKLVQLTEDTRPPVSTKPKVPRKRDYEYRRKGTANCFVTVEPRGGFRTVRVTARRTKRDFAEEIARITGLERYRDATTIHLVLDNLNTHFPKSFHETFGAAEATRILDRIVFHYTPKHGSWLNMAEIEIGILSRACVRGHRHSDQDSLRRSIRAHQTFRNRRRRRITWRFTKRDAREVFTEYYESKLVG